MNRVNKKYDYLIVGAGLFGSSFANYACEKNKSVLIIDKRNHLGGNIYTKNIEGIDVHIYGGHIFHTDSKEIWDFVN
ncbi:MAG: NAD(P)-binding protein, partial [Clostridiales Family XIII bacterium]|nr:NAD(P)-binding protein [Clostridiales Family XIII bacterium]